VGIIVSVLFVMLSYCGNYCECFVCNVSYYGNYCECFVCNIVSYCGNYCEYILWIFK
jgi:cellulose synthase/poly-beta-1,6-N-acetylglucosamine synthase-like glycosyltransferase